MWYFCPILAAILEKDVPDLLCPIYHFEQCPLCEIYEPKAENKMFGIFI